MVRPHLIFPILAFCVGLHSYINLLCLCIRDKARDKKEKRRDRITLVCCGCLLGACAICIVIMYK